ncbi:CPBP family intramembrane glutamic endopeptidase [Oceanobacillus iheyensis]|uniref:CPBP family intramembrane glutamic endopeptidase n=1 Tax=Oceanobacillus iheyensis TaxID=182710 RepID=UPI003635FE8B
MKKKKVFQKPLVGFIALTYAIFIVFFIGIGISLLLEVPPSITNTLQIISSWSSTFAFLILFKRIYPGVKLITFVKELFTIKIKLSVLTTIIIIQVIIIVTTIFILSHINQSLALFYLGPLPLFIMFIDNLVRGPLGEELGWRGYALNELQKRYSPLKSSIIVGVLWGGWHTPLWFAMGYTGIHLFKYILLFMIGILSFSIIMAFFYNLNKNLMIPIIMHQLFNYSLVIVKGDLLDILTYVMILYLVVAILLISINPKSILY